MITQLRNVGLNVVRMNFSHGSYEVREGGKSVVQKLTETFIVPSICY